MWVVTTVLLVTVGLARLSRSHADVNFINSMINTPTFSCSTGRGCPESAMCREVKRDWSKCVCPADAVLLHGKCSKLDGYANAQGRCGRPSAGGATSCVCPDQSVPVVSLCAAVFERRASADGCDLVSDNANVNVTSGVLRTFPSGCRNANQVYPLCFQKALRFARDYKTFLVKSGPSYDLTRLAYAMIYIVPDISEPKHQEMLKFAFIVSAAVACVHNNPSDDLSDLISEQIPNYWKISKKEFEAVLKGVQVDATRYNRTMDWLAQRLLPLMDGRSLARSVESDKEAAATSLVYVLMRALCWNHKTDEPSDGDCVKDSFDRHVDLWRRVVYLLPGRDALKDLIWYHRAHPEYRYARSQMHRCLHHRFASNPQFSIFDLATLAGLCFAESPDEKFLLGAGVLNNPALPFVNRRDSVSEFIDPAFVGYAEVKHKDYRRRFDPHEIIVDYLKHVRSGSFDKMSVHPDEVASTVLGLLDLRRYSVQNPKGLYYLALRLALMEHVTFEASPAGRYSWIVEFPSPSSPDDSYEHESKLAELTDRLHEWYEICVADAEAAVMAEMSWRSRW